MGKFFRIARIIYCAFNRHDWQKVGVNEASEGMSLHVNGIERCRECFSFRAQDRWHGPNYWVCIRGAERRKFEQIYTRALKAKEQGQ